MYTARRLPGIEVAAAPPPAAEALPRMDVAVFVGFAATGPLHLPVVIDGVAQFAAVFGPDAPLAWDEARGERATAYLGRAVRAFFANGGQRCWVVRVARSAATEALRGVLPTSNLAASNTFAVPGVLAVFASGAKVRAAIAQARSEGSWSDRLRVATALLRQGFHLEALTADTSPPSGQFHFRTRHGLRAGDLIGLGDAAGACWYAVVDKVRAVSEAGGPYLVQASMCAAFERLAATGSPPIGVSGSGTARIEGFTEEVAATLFPPASRGSPQESMSRLHFDAPLAARLERGHWVRWSGGGAPVWLRIDAIGQAAAATASPSAEAGASLIDIEVSGPAWRELDSVLAPTVDAFRSAEVLTLELQVAGTEQRSHLAGVGLTPRHPAAWWTHLNDLDFYGPPGHSGSDRTAEGQSMDPEPRANSGGASRGRTREVEPTNTPRFPLCRAAEPAPLAWIPLGVEPLFGVAVGPLPQQATALERDGLARFDAALFLDPELADASVRELPGLADGIRFLRAQPRPLLGMHSAFSVGAGGVFNEASLLAIPDAVHPGWTRRKETALPDPIPPVEPAPPHWRTHRGGCPSSDDTPLQAPDFSVFLDCGTRALEAPGLEGPEEPVLPGAFRLWWTDSEPGAEYVLLEATRTDLADAREVYRGPGTEHVPLAQREGVYFYRVFAQFGPERSGGSNVVPVRVRQEAWVLNDPAADEEEIEREWLTIHRAALRLAAASGDLFVALATPRHFRTQQALRYADRLRMVRQPFAGGDADTLGFTEAHALSYGALYFPWLHSDARSPGATLAGEEPGAGSVAARRSSPVVLPPDGAALGVLAARATGRGAWVAPANAPFRDIVGVTPRIGREDWQALQDAQVNLVRLDPRGVLVLSADTLATEPQLRPINVRRLLILLRRLALRRGTTYVFEPNGPVLRRAVQRGFELLLTEMFRRGAFAGATAEQSFRVVTDDTVNTPRDTDAGRFVVELRVAPSVPLRFIAVRLAQTGGRLSVTEEL